jgi:LysM repeat protein
MPPADTATPTIAPTPVIHTVQQGETLQGIAFDYGVGLGALQAANDIDSPQFLQVGQDLIIPVEQEEAQDASSGLLLPTPTPLAFQRQGVAFYETPVGGLWGLGEVVNSTESPLTNVQLRVALFDASGELLLESDTFAVVDLIPPGAQSPFGILFTDPPQDWARSEVTIIRGQEAGALGSSYVPMSVSEVEGRPTGSQFQVKGVAQNDSEDVVAARATVVVTTYDAQGTVTGFRERRLDVEEGLSPGATVPFELIFTFYGDSPADFSVIAQGRSSTQ